MKNKTLRVMFYVLLLLPLFPIPYFKNNIVLFDCVYSSLEIFSGIVIFILLLRYKKISKIMIYILVFLGILLFSTILNSGDLSTCMRLIYRTIVACAIYDLGIKTNANEIIKASNILLSIIVILNFISVLLYPNGMYVTTAGYTSNWLLDFKNFHILYILPAIFFNFLSSYLKYNKLKLKNYIFLLICFLSILLVNSSTSISALAVFIILIILSRLFSTFGKINIYQYYLTYIALFLIIIIFKLQNLFSYYVEMTLHKNLTFTGRTYIWDAVIGFIKQKKLFGYGLEFAKYRYTKTFLVKSAHAHNELLEIIYKTGIIGFVSFLFILLASAKKLYINRSNIISKLISMTIFAYLIIMLTEAYNFDYFMFIFVIAYNVKYIIGGVKNE